MRHQICMPICQKLIHLEYYQIHVKKKTGMRHYGWSSWKDNEIVLIVLNIKTVIPTTKRTSPITTGRSSHTIKKNEEIPIIHIRFECRVFLFGHTSMSLPLFCCWWYCIRVGRVKGKRITRRWIMLFPSPRHAFHCATGCKILVGVLLKTEAKW